MTKRCHDPQVSVMRKEEKGVKIEY